MLQELSEIDSISLHRREQWVLMILAAVQFTSVVDFMIVMPLGPQLMRALDVGPKEFGLIVSSYTFAAGVAGLLASSVIDRFARRKMFMILYSGFLLGTLFCGWAPTYRMLVLARIGTGFFGGILGGMSMTIVGDVFPEHRRGQATGSLMTGFALASVAGVPFGLVLGTNFGWHVPFVALALGGLPVLLLTPFALPPLDGHVGQVHAPPLRSLVETLSHPNHLKAFALIVSLMASGFMVFPYLSAYFVANVGMTEQQLPLLYICGGGLVLVSSRTVGRWADRFGKLRVYRVAAPLAALFLLTITHLPVVPVLVGTAVFGALMVSNMGRMISAMSIIISSVEPRRRGGFLSANASVQHVSSGMGAYLGGLLIREGPHGRIEHFGTVGWIAASVTLVSLWLAGRVQVIDEEVSAEDLSLTAAAEATADG